MLFKNYVKLPEKCSTTLHSPRPGTVVFTSPQAVFKVEGKQVTKLAQFDGENCRDHWSRDLAIMYELVIPPEIVGEYILYGEQNTFSDSTVHCIDCSGNEVWRFSQKDRKLAQIMACPDGGCYLVSCDVTPQPETQKKYQCKFEVIRLNRQGHCEEKYSVGRVRKTVMVTKTGSLLLAATIREGYYDDPVVRDTYHPEICGLLQISPNREPETLREYDEDAYIMITPAPQQSRVYLFQKVPVEKKSWFEIYDADEDGILQFRERCSPVLPLGYSNGVWYLDYSGQNLLCESKKTGPYQPYVLRATSDTQPLRMFLPVPRTYQREFKEIIDLPNGMVISIWQESLTEERSWQGRLVIHYNGKMRALTTKKQIGHIAVFDDTLYVSEGHGKSWWLTWCSIKELEDSFAAL